MHVPPRPADAEIDNSPHADVIRQAVPVVAPDTACAEVRRLFVTGDEVPAVAVVAAGVPQGLVGRAVFLGNMSRPYWPEIYDRSPIADLMDRDPVTVERTALIEDVARVVLHDRTKAIQDGFLIVDAGAYAGFASAADLMRVTARLAEQRNAHLAQALQHVTAASQAKTTFLANVSHELRTPLNAVIGFSDLLRQEFCGPLNEQQMEQVVMINDSGQLLLTLVNDLLDLSVAESGRMELHEELVDLGEIVDTCFNLCGPRAAMAAVDLVRGPAADICLTADEMKLKQVVLNLMTNAVKFTPPGGSVTVSTGLNARGAVEIAVTDTGIGIPPQDLERVLEPFTHASDGRAQKNQGAGLGLPLSKALAELHGGALAIDSTVGRGTTVRVTLPSARLDGYVRPAAASA